MPPTNRKLAAEKAGVHERTAAYWEGRWIPTAESVATEEYERSLAIVRFLRERLVPRDVDVVLAMIRGGERSFEMPKFDSVVEEVDAALSAAIRISPGTPVETLKRELFDRFPDLYERLRAESSDQSFEGRQKFLEAQARCFVIGKGQHAIALAGAQEVLGYRRAAAASQATERRPSPGARTLEEIDRLTDEAVKANPKLDRVAARSRVFAERPDLYHAYRTQTTRRKGGK